MYNDTINRHTKDMEAIVMKKIVEWNVGYIESLVPDVETFLNQEFEGVSDFDEEGNLNINVDDMFDRACESILEYEGMFGIIEGDDFEDFRELLWIAFEKKHPHFFEDAIDEVEEQYREYKEFQRDPLGYHGLSQKDFL